MMVTLFDQETVLENHVASLAREAAAKAAKKAAAKADKAARADERLTTIKSLMKTMHWSPIEVMNAMEIPPDQQAIYIKKLR